MARIQWFSLIHERYGDGLFSAIDRLILQHVLC
jgi:cyanate lyase